MLSNKSILVKISVRDSVYTGTYGDTYGNMVSLEKFLCYRYWLISIFETYLVSELVRICVYINVHVCVQFASVLLRCLLIDERTLY